LKAEVSEEVKRKRSVGAESSSPRKKEGITSMESDAFGIEKLYSKWVASEDAI